MKQLEELKQARLNQISNVKHLDKIGGDGKECDYLIYIDAEEPDYYGTNTIPKSFWAINDLIPHILMRTNNISLVEARDRATKSQAVLVVEDLKNLLVYTYTYIVIH